MQRSAWFILLVMGATVCGCAQPAPENPSAGEASPPAELHGPRPDKPAQAAPKAGEQAESEQPAPAPEAQAKFDPPYKNRVDMFQPPNRKHAVKNSNSTSEVLLRGFVNVDQPKALLVVDGKLRAMAAGEHFNGLELIQIDRPLVTLQRGRVRWTESLYPEG